MTRFFISTASLVLTVFLALTACNDSRNSVDNLPKQTADSLSIEEKINNKFDWSIQTLDRWLIKRQPVCDNCPDNIPTLNVDSIQLEFDYKNKMVRMTDIFDALSFLQELTGIETTIQYNLGTFGIMCTDCSSYNSDRQNWTVWFQKNKTNISADKIAKLKLNTP